jgi:hypothetical protein
MVIAKIGNSGDQPNGLGLQLNGPGYFYQYDGGQVRSELSRAQIQATIGGLPASTQTLTYYKYVNNANGSVTIDQVVVQIVPVDFKIGISSVPSQTGGVYTFKNVELWYALDGTTWTNAYASAPPNNPVSLSNSSTVLCSSTTRDIFPIIAWIQGYQDITTNPTYINEAGASTGTAPDSGIAGFTQITPSLAGRQIDLYTGPSTTYDLGLQSDTVKNTDLLQAAMNPDALPDGRFASTVYFRLDLNSYGAYMKATGFAGLWSSWDTWYPSTQYEVRALYAISGEYVYLWTNTTANQNGYNDTTWTPRNSTVIVNTDPFTAWVNGIESWFSNPLNSIGLLIGLVAVGIILVVILLIATPLGRSILNRTVPPRRGNRGMISIVSVVILLLIFSVFALAAYYVMQYGDLFIIPPVASYPLIGAMIVLLALALSILALDGLIHRKAKRGRNN